MKLRLAQPSVLVDIGRLSDLSYIRDDGDHIAIGALTRHMDVETSDVLAEHVPLLAHAASHVGDPQVRHRGTIGGSIAHADPASDLPATTLALGATYVAQGPNGTPRDRRRRLLRGLPRDGAGAPTRCSTEIRVPKMQRRRLELPEVQPAGPGLGDRRRRRVAPQRRQPASGSSTWARRRSWPPACRNALPAARRSPTPPQLAAADAEPQSRPQRQRRVPRAPRQGARPPRARSLLNSVLQLLSLAW